MNPKPIQNADPLQTWLESFRPCLNIFLDAYCILDSTGRIIEFNLAFSELVGESHRRIHKVGNLSALLKTKGETELTEVILKSSQPVRMDEVLASSKSYPELTIILGSVPIIDASGQFCGALVTIRNVTAEHALLMKYEERKKEAVFDGLTQLLNKVNSEDAISKSIKIALRENKPFSVVMGDIDHFKRVNDTYGHQAGDYVLKLVSSIIKNVMRETDIAGRFGGEEFVILLKNCPENGALIFSERLRKSIESTLFIFEGKRIPITISQGTATIHRAWEDGMVLEQMAQDLVKEADSALYEAKSQGRNRVVSFQKKSA